MPAGVSAYVPLANITLGSTATTVTFSSISQTYRDLVLIVNGGTSGGSDNTIIQFNGDTGTNYPQVFANGSGSAAAREFTSSNKIFIKYYGGTPTDLTYNAIVNIMDYSTTNKHKTVLVRDNNSANSTEMGCGRWANTAAITSIAVSGPSRPWLAGTTMSLYGVSA